MPRVAPLVCAVAALWVSLPVHGRSFVQDPRVDVDEVVEAVVRYVDRYRREFAFLLADETSVQTATVAATGDRQVRTLTGEIFLSYLPADRHWIAVHDVIEVDGQPVPDREDLRTLLAAGSVRSVAARVAARNARYNLGRVVRNFNEPTLVLQLFEAGRHDRVRFSREAVTLEAGGPTLVTLGFRERERPTLVSAVGGGSVFAEGEVLVEADSGLVRRTTIRVEDAPVTAELETHFQFDQDVQLWVPSVFVERYRFDADGRRETIVGESRYANYRRFEVTGRLLVPGEP